MIELDRLDDLVSDYLLFRGYEASNKNLKYERQCRLENDSVQEKSHVDVLHRIMNSIDRGDYPRLLSLWNTYIVQPYSSNQSLIGLSSVECYLNLCCAVYPFRKEVYLAAGTPAVAARVAARSMTIFKHYVESRGKLIISTPDFQIYKNLHKIAFPPTHPHFTHLFKNEWLLQTRSTVLEFLTRVLKPKANSELVRLFSSVAYRGSSNGKSSIDDEERMCKKGKEQTLNGFSRALLDMSNDLLTTLESGKETDRKTVQGLRDKIEGFKEALGPLEEDALDVASEAGDDDQSDLSTDANGGHGSVSLKRRASGHVSKKKKKSSRRTRSAASLESVELKSVNFANVIIDLSSMFSEIEEILISAIKPGSEISGVDGELCRQSAMQTCAMLFTLRTLIHTQPPSLGNTTATATATADLGHGGVSGVLTRSAIVTSVLASNDVLMLQSAPWKRESMSSITFVGRDMSVSGLTGNGPIISFLNELAHAIESRTQHSSLVKVVATPVPPKTKPHPSTVPVSVEGRTAVPMSESSLGVLGVSLIMSSCAAKLIAALGAQCQSGDAYLSANGGGGGGNLTTALVTLFLDIHANTDMQSDIDSALGLLVPSSDHVVSTEKLMVSNSILMALLAVGALRPQYLASAFIRKGGADWVVKHLLTPQRNGEEKQIVPEELAARVLSTALFRLLSQTEDFRRAMLTSTKVLPEDVQALLHTLMDMVLTFPNYAKVGVGGSDAGDLLGVLSTEALWWLCQEPVMLEQLKDSFDIQIEELRKRIGENVVGSMSDPEPDLKEAIPDSSELPSLLNNVLVSFGLVTPASAAPSSYLLTLTLKLLIVSTREHAVVVEYCSKNKADTGMSLIARYSHAVIEKQNDNSDV